jgi:AcrR family transcriptional regulator
MADKRASRSQSDRDRWEARVAALGAEPETPRARREPLTVRGIVTAGLGIVERDGYEAVTMRSVAAAVDATPAALYAHVRDKADLDDLMIGELCSRVAIPAPDPARFRQQVGDIYAQLRDQFLANPGIARATFNAAPHSLDTLRITEGILAILVAAGVPGERAAWFADAALLYTTSYCVMAVRRPADDTDDGRIARLEVIEQFRMLPQDRFPMTFAHAEDLVSGVGHARYEFTLGLMLDGLAPPGR